MFVRHPANPLLTPAAVKPLHADYTVIGTFNAGVTQYQTETLLLVRVAERPNNPDPSVMVCPYIADDGTLTTITVRRDDPAYDTSDPRMVRHQQTGRIYLTSISHLRLARSQDGVTFSVADQAWLRPQPPYETYGIEDARITYMEDEGVYYVNYSAVSPHGIATCLAVTTDFISVQRHGVIFLPSNRDVVLFPRRINGLYVAYHRPMPAYSAQYNMWSATSPDLLHWGQHALLYAVTDSGWESGRVGGGAPPLWTERGWLSFYHAADPQDRYCLGAFLTAHDEPAMLIARALTPVLEPSALYEREGFYGNVVFTCGALLKNGRLHLYYGAADERVALAEAALEDVLNALTPI